MNKQMLFGIILLVAIAVFTVPAAAEDYNIFYLVPQESNAAGPCNNTTVWVMLNTSHSNIAGAMAIVYFDHTIVNITNVEEADSPDWQMDTWWSRVDYTGQHYVKLKCLDLFGAGHGPGELQIGKMTLHCENNGISSLVFADTDVPGDILQVTDMDNNVLNYTVEDGTFNCGGAQTFTKDLPAGWNLISLPFDPTVNSVSAVLSGVEQNAVKQYNAVSKQFEDAATMDPGTGYFVHVTTASTWSYSGMSESSTSTELKSGLNMIGVPNCGMNVSDAMGTTEYRYAARWNATSQSYEVYNPNAPTAFHGFSTMEPGEGYFISAKSAATLPISCP